MHGCYHWATCSAAICRGETGGESKGPAGQPASPSPRNSFGALPPAATAAATEAATLRPSPRPSPRRPPLSPRGRRNVDLYVLLRGSPGHDMWCARACRQHSGSPTGAKGEKKDAIWHTDRTYAQFTSAYVQSSLSFFACVRRKACAAGFSASVL